MGKGRAIHKRNPQHDTHAKVQLTPAPHGCYDYECLVCKRVYPFYDQALDCALGHKLEKLSQKSHKHSRHWSSRRY